MNYKMRCNLFLNPYDFFHQLKFKFEFEFKSQNDLRNWPTEKI